MKIEQRIRSSIDANIKEDINRPSGNLKFDQMVQSKAAQLSQTELHRLMSELTNQGKRITRYRSLKDLAVYKRLVKKFIKEAVDHGVELKHFHGSMVTGDTRKLVIVEEIDEKLMELTEAVMDQEKGSVDLLAMIGEIKGLLINLYT
ncbi:hypothetical protein GGQ92_002760 [Gracilibacillus halotolerans]|uniref:DUF327 domain-containing protein n=1 Tax=Gracilibacillus halotolerans TaxID=74386 RepID=A0A841RMD4_9BACI|nr:YaaR family protein [Gracilibacillus halotolerans]MBB6513941.1 hypothetical protein [Gracilibacillus halotolerans]